MQPISQSISQSMSQPMSQPMPQPTQPTQPTPQPTPPAPSEVINYGIDDVLDDIHTSDQPTESAPAPTVVEDEVCFTLPFRQGGFFRTWLSSFFVINREMIIMYPNEKRNDRKRKEILLYDATASHSQVSSDSKHPFCVSIRPGPCSTRKKDFVIALPSKEEETAFLGVLERYMAIARQNPPAASAGSYEEDEE
ncbi:hypothetical protein WA538_005138 [Blastocystis sp. DL]